MAFLNLKVPFSTDQNLTRYDLALLHNGSAPNSLCHNYIFTMSLGSGVLLQRRIEIPPYFHIGDSFVLLFDCNINYSRLLKVKTRVDILSRVYVNFYEYFLTLSRNWINVYTLLLLYACIIY